MRMDELKKKSTDELQKMVADKREGLRAFRFGSAGSRSKNVREGRTLRREIAQVMTELRARQIASTAKIA